MGVDVGFIQNLIGPRWKRCVNGVGVDVDVKEDWQADEFSIRA